MQLPRLLLSLAFVSLGFLGFSQEKPRSDKETTRLHYYSFQGQASPEQLDFLQQDLKRMSFVTEVKIEYKAEKSAGQVRLISKEKAIVSEGDKQFSAVDIKRLLIAKGFMPVEYHNEVLSN